MAIHRHHCLMILLLSAVLSLPVSAKNLALGDGHSCAISASGQVMCWGSNSSGQLGNGSGGGISSNTVIAKLDPKDVPVAIAAGGAHTCVLLKTGLVKCWGDNSAGQLGTGKISATETTPVSVVTLNGVKAIAAGAKHTCALHSWGFVKCWGDNQYGQLGNGKQTNSALPVAPSFVPSGLIDLAMGNHHSCVLTQNKSVSCWGKNAFGQLGNNSLINSSTAVNTLLTQPAMSIDAGNDHTCTIMADKTVRCWGWNGRSQQGPKKYSGNNPSPVAVPGLSNIGALALGYAHTCALNVAAAGKPKLLCLGANNHAELGLGNATAYDIEKPTPIIITDPIIDVAAGSDHTCANTTITGVPILKCWGNDTFGQLGLDPMSPSLKTDPNNPGLKFSIAPTSPGKWTVSSASIPLDAAPSPPIPAPTASPPPPVACTYTYSEWTACKLESWGYWQTRYLTSKSSLTCVGAPVVGQACVPPPAPKPSPAQTPACPADREWTYWYGGQPHTECGCTTVNADKDAAGKPIPWMGDKFIMVYFSGGAYKTDWAYRNDGLPLYQGPWYYAAKDGRVNNIPNGFTTNAAVPPINGFTMIADNQWWGAMKPKKVYVSGQKLGTTYKNCTAPNLPTGGAPSVSATEKYWSEQKTIVGQLMTQLANAADSVITAKANLQKEVATTLEPIITTILTSKGKPTFPEPPVATSKAAYDAAVTNLQTLFGQIHTILSNTMKLDGDTPTTQEIRTVLGQATAAYMNALFTASVKLPLSDAGKPNCKWDPVKDQLIYKVALGASPETLQNLVSSIQCLPQRSMNMLDEALSTAFIYTMAAVKKFHPLPYYSSGIQDQLLGTVSPVVITIYERTRFQGQYVPSRSIMQLYADRVKSLKPNTTAPSDTGVSIIPNTLMLYNPGTKLFETVKFCPESLMTSPDMVWNDTYKCMYYPNFIKTVMDPKMDNAGTCLFWDTARLGKPCLAPLPPKTSRLEQVVRFVVAQLDNALISTAYANPLDVCPTEDQETNLCGKCVSKSAGTPQVEAPKTKCEILCGDCTAPTTPEICLKTLHCPFDPSPWADEPEALKQAIKAYTKNLAGCQGIVQECFEYCNANNKLICTCGNWKIDAGEDCDDGNMKNGDGCNSTCKNETSPLCGNGKLDPGEECEDGNKINNDGCTNECKKVPINCFEVCLNSAKSQPVGTPCGQYFKTLEDSKNPQCVISSTPWGGKNCDLAPFKPGDPCWMQLQYTLHECRKDPKLVKCISECKTDLPETELTPDMQSECQKNPPLLPIGWQNNFNQVNVKLITDILNAVDPSDFYGNSKKAGLKLFDQRWDDLVTVFQNTHGIPVSIDVSNKAKMYAKEKLAEAKACTGTKLAEMVQNEGGGVIQHRHSIAMLESTIF